MATIGALASVFDASGKMLLVNQAYAPFRWTQPGGRVESGEFPNDAVVREVLEETALKVTVDHLIGTYYAAYKDDVVFHFLCRADHFNCIARPPRSKKHDSLDALSCPRISPSILELASRMPLMGKILIFECFQHRTLCSTHFRASSITQKSC